MDGSKALSQLDGWLFLKRGDSQISLVIVIMFGWFVQDMCTTGFGLAVSLREVSLFRGYITKGSPLGDTLSLSCEASVGTSGSNN